MAVLFLGSIVLTLSHFSCLFFWFYITHEFDIVIIFISFTFNSGEEGSLDTSLPESAL